MGSMAPKRKNKEENKIKNKIRKSNSKIIIKFMF